jgi:hypothetical protein
MNERMADEGLESGGCLCGAVRYDFDPSSVVNASHCHCRDCQHSTGSGFTTFVAVRDRSFKLASGELRSFSVTGDSGGTLTRSFCPECGSPIVSTTSIVPSLVFVKDGSLDDPSWVDPSSAYWGSSAEPWAPPDTGIPVHDRNPT